MHGFNTLRGTNIHQRDKTLTGSPNNDYLEGETTEASRNYWSISGHEGNDRLIGSLGGDFLTGGDGEDVLVGKGGDDELAGGERPSYAIAGSTGTVSHGRSDDDEADEFHFGSDDGSDGIWDFAPGTPDNPLDKIVLLGGGQEDIDNVVASAEAEPNTGKATVFYGDTVIYLAGQSPEDVADYWFTVA